ncbi:hypothetical protein LR48_Vigan05g101200 [Vigna angularis]|uniref:Uncharacterized protein n=1 Tax=Phaseolus angularis TaxID=3914 RepID=A0A0L9UKX2_PHAAN|nr:hypothetical protein LR48_Vigan05g101200 [Vigna angularis]
MKDKNHPQIPRVAALMNQALDVASIVGPSAPLNVLDRGRVAGRVCLLGHEDAIADG